MKLITALASAIIGAYISWVGLSGKIVGGLVDFTGYRVMEWLWGASVIKAEAQLDCLYEFSSGV
jgi:hypothetical protein